MTRRARFPNGLGTIEDARHGQREVRRERFRSLAATTDMYQLAFDEEADFLAAERLNRSGVALAESGQLEEAAAAFQAALARDGAVWTAHNNLGIVLARLRRFDRAAECFRLAILRQPASAQARNNLGNALAELGQYDRAVESFEQALRLDPDYADAHHNLGKVLSRLCRYDQAAACFERVLAAQPDRAAARRQLGQALAAQGKSTAAIHALRQAVELDAEDAENHFQLACALRAAGRRGESIATLKRAVRLRPDYCEALSALGVAMTHEGHAERACQYFQQAAERCGETPTLWCNWGIALAALGRHADALALYGKALEARPDHAEVVNNAATALGGMCRYAEALAGYQRAIAIKPDYADAHRNRGIMYLLLGDFERAWADFEWRWKCRDFQPAKCAQPLWDGAPLDGRAILLRAEQGLGDTLQFIRYAALVKARGGKVLARVPRALQKLLARTPGIDRLVIDDDFKDFDVHLPLMSLPKVFGTTLDTIPAAVPYLFADERLVAYWRDRLFGKVSPLSPGEETIIASRGGDPKSQIQKPKSLLVGIAWQGNPRYPADAQRSVPLAFFAPLAQAPGVRLVSLQQGHGSEQLMDVADQFLVSELPGRVDREHGRFMDTAAVMMLLDLVITSDTAVAHLAGGLGVKVWMATPYAPDWRWLLDRDDSPWYPTMRLFRQPSPGDWTSVFASMAVALRKLAPAARGRKAARTIAAKQVAEPLLRRAATLASSGKLRESLDVLDRAVWRQPRLLEAHYHRGTVLDGLGEFAQAAAAFRRCLRLAPQNPAALASLGAALAHLGHFERAEQELRCSLRLDGAAVENHLSLGNILAGRGQWEPALDCFRRALQIEPGFAAAHVGSANVLRQQSRFQEAIAAYDRALELRPAFRQARRMRAETFLLLGDLDRGFRELVSDRDTGHQAYAPRGTGAALVGLACKSLFVTSGGDLAEPSHRLRFADPLMAPLEVKQARVERWRRELALLGGFRVGVEWHSDERDGVAPREWIESLARIPGVQLVHLPRRWPRTQARIADREGNALHHTMLQYTMDGAVVPRVASAMDLAAVIANLDLVIATDGPAAHLAGALAVPLNVPLPLVPHWCWFLDRTDSPFYASATLFRQSRRGDWTDVCAAIEERLKKVVRGESVAVPGQAEAERFCAQGQRLAQSGNLSAALECCRRATEVAPAFAPAYNYLGAAYRRLGRHVEAAEAYRGALKRMPFYPEALLNLGLALASCGDAEEAVRVFRQAVRQRPHWPRAQLCLGNALASLGQWRAACERFGVAASLDPADAETHVKLGAARRETGQLEQSAAALEKALFLRPGHVHTLNHLAVTYCRQRLYARAVECLHDALRRRPDFAAAHNNLGIALAHLNRHREAIAAYDRALTLDCHYAEAYNNLGISYTSEGRFEEAVGSFARAIELRPDYAEAHNNQGIALKELGEGDRALAGYNRALAIDANYADAHLNRALAWLQRGDFESGWREYEWRLSLPRRRASFCQPRWRGEPHDRGTLLLHCEQGLGDTIQFIRYASLVKQRVERVVVRCPARLQNLLRHVEGIAELIGDDEPLPVHDCHLPLLSLPYVFGTTLATVPCRVPYLSADTALVDFWRARVNALWPSLDGGATRRLRVGVNWQGNAHYQGDRQRSFSPEFFSPLRSMPGVALISLQKGVDARHLEAVCGQGAENGMAFFDHLGDDVDETNGAFMDTAAVMMSLDLVITSDTAVAHLAGALGRPVWLALPQSADWRWLCERDDSPWYPTMRLYRQPAPGNWVAVFRRIADDLRRMYQEPQASLGA